MFSYNCISDHSRHLYAEAGFPLNILLSIALSIFVRGDHTNFEIEPSFGVEASELYPDVNHN
jgi:pterocarpan reductase